MNERHIVMLVKNTFTNDARVEREALGLIEIGFKVSVIALVDSKAPANEIRNGIYTIRVPRILNTVRRLGDPVASGSTDFVTSASLLTPLKRAIWHIARIISQTQIAIPAHKIQDSRMIAAATKLSPDLIYSHDLDTLKAATLIGDKLQIPSIYDSHEMATGRSLNSRNANKRARELEGSLISQVNLIVMASEGYAERASQMYGIPKPVTIRNVPDFRIPDKTKNLRLHFQIPQDALLLVHQGSIQPDRGIEQILHALVLIPDTNLAIIGYGSHLMAIKELVNDLNLINRVHFLGTVTPEELIDWSSSADIGMCTIVGNSDSYRHSMPNKLFEYVMSGIPIISSNYPGMGTFTTTNEIGLVCNPIDINAVASVISILAEDKTARQRMSENSKKLSKSVNWGNEKIKFQQAVLSVITP